MIRPRRRRLTLGQYVRFRLSGARGREAWFNFFIRPFAAPSIAEFWRRWNPVYGYFLSKYSYRPLLGVMPRQAAIFSTFVVCGLLLHDVPAWIFARRVLPPGATIAFSTFGAGALVSERCHMNLSRQPVTVRAAVNGGYLIGSIGVMLVAVSWLRKARKSS